MFHFRTSTGKEVDPILENRRRQIVGIEVKAAVSIDARDFTGLKFLRELAGDKFQAGIVLYSGKELFPMGEKMWAVPLSTVWRT